MDPEAFRSQPPGAADPGAGPGGPGTGAPPPPPGVPRGEPPFGARVLALFLSPTRAFASPRGPSFWILPVLIILVANVVFGYLLHDLLAEWLQNFVATTPELPDAQRDEMMDALARSTDVGGFRFWLDTILGSVSSVGFTFFFAGLLYMIGINFGLGGEARYLDSVGVLGLSSLVLVVREAITLPLKLGQGTLAIYTSPAAFLDSDGSVLFTVAGFFDVFELYRLVLLAIGFGVVGRVTTAKAATVVTAYWILWCIIRLLWRMSPFGAATP